MAAPTPSPGPLPIPPRCGIYCRISADDRGDELGVRRQERNCRDLVDRLDGNVARVYVDNDRSASAGAKTRDGFEALIADLKAGAVDLVVVQNQDRISRDNVEVELFMRLLRSLGHDHYWTASAGRQGITTTNDRLGYRVKGLFDTAYSEYISEKVTEHKADLAAKGLPNGGRRAFGWSCHTRGRDHATCGVPGCLHDGGMSLVPGEAADLHRAAHIVLDGGTLQAAADAVNLPSVGGRPLRAVALKRMLMAPRMAGLRVHHGDIVGPAVWPAILDRDVWERLRSVLAERYLPQARPRRHLLSGVVTCGACGVKLSAQFVDRGARRQPMYWCRANRGGCGRVAVNVGDRLEATVLDAVAGWLRDPDLAAEITAILRGDGVEGTASLLAEIQGAEDDLKRLARERELLGLELFEYQAMRAPVKEQLDRARSQLAGLRRRNAVAAPLGAVTVEEIAAEFEGMSPGEQRDVIGLLAGVVKVMPVGKGHGCRFQPDRVKITPVWAT